MEAHVIPAEWSSAIIDSLLVYYGLGAFGCWLFIVIHQHKLKQQQAAYWREKDRR